VVPPILGATSHKTGLFMPAMIAGDSLAAVKPVQDFTLSPWAEAGIVALYAIVLLGVGCWSLVHRDA
jgi:hypothetical protein